MGIAPVCRQAGSNSESVWQCKKKMTYGNEELYAVVNCWVNYIRENCSAMRLSAVARTLQNLLLQGVETAADFYLYFLDLDFASCLSPDRLAKSNSCDCPS